MQYVSSVDVTFNDITLTEIFEEGWVYDTLWVDEGCFVDGTGFPRCKIEGKNIRFPNGPSFSHGNFFIPRVEKTSQN